MLEDRSPELRRHVVFAPRQMHEREVPQEMIPEPAQMRAGLDGRGQPRDTRVERRHLVERVGERVDRPRVPWVLPIRHVSHADRLVAAAGLFEDERVQAEHVRATGMVTSRRVGERQHLRELPLPEPDEVEALEDQEISRIVHEMLPHRARRVDGLALDQQREALDVAPLAVGLRARRRARGLRDLVSLGEALLQEEADRRTRMGERQSWIERRGRAEALEGLSIQERSPSTARS